MEDYDQLKKQKEDILRRQGERQRGEVPSGALINHEHGCVTVRTEKGFLLWMGTAGGSNSFSDMIESVIDNNKKDSQPMSR